MVVLTQSFKGGMSGVRFRLNLHKRLYILFLIRSWHLYSEIN